YYQALATYPRVIMERTTPPLLFGLAPRGVFPAGRIAPVAVRSYRTISPLPRERGGIFSVALSVEGALSASPRLLAGTLSCGDRTFLSLFQERLPVRQATCLVSHVQGP